MEFRGIVEGMRGDGEGGDVGSGVEEEERLGELWV